MKLSDERLAAHLADDLRPVYLITGDDVLLVREAVDAVRRSARQRGFGGRELFTVDRGFDWTAFAESCAAMSLFSDRRTIELRLPSGRPGEAGSRALTAYLENPSAEIVLVIVTGKLDRAALNSRWCRAVDKVGTVVQVWPLDVRQLPGWIQRRMHDKGLDPSVEAVEILAERIEGNLLAADQEIEKLHLLLGSGQVRETDVVETVANSARFDIYKLADAALTGDPLRTSRIVRGLQEEGAEPVLVLWALARDLRQLAAMGRECRSAPVDAVVARHAVWPKRRRLIRAALARHPAEYWRVLLERAGHVDRVIKGASAGNAWDELLQLSLLIAGIQILEPAAGTRPRGPLGRRH